MHFLCVTNFKFFTNFLLTSLLPELPAFRFDFRYSVVLISFLFFLEINGIVFSVFLCSVSSFVF